MGIAAPKRSKPRLVRRFRLMIGASLSAAGASLTLLGFLLARNGCRFQAATGMPPPTDCEIWYWSLPAIVAAGCGAAGLCVGWAMFIRARGALN